MRKSYIILGLIMALLIAFAVPGMAIKIAPYSQPLHDIMHWDVTSAKLIIQNPEGESQTVSWPATVDLWNYNGNTWTFDLPSGDKFAFSKRVDFNIATTEGAGSTVRALSVTDTVGAAGAIHEALYVNIDSEYATGNWANAIVGRIDYGALGSASGGLAASICAEMNLAPIASPGGSYYGVHTYMNFPTSIELIDSTAFNYAFERYETADPDHEFDLYGLLWHIVGLDDATTKIWYDNTLKIQIDTTKWYIPLSDAEGLYSTAYPIVSTNATQSTTTTSGAIYTSGGLGVVKDTFLGGILDVAGVATFAVQDIHTLGLTVADGKAIVQGMNTFPKLTVTVLTSAAGYTMTAAQMLSGLISDTSGTGAIAATLPTVADVVALIDGYVVGTSFYLDYSNPGNQTVTVTVDASAQWTLVGTMTIATVTHRRFLCVINSATTGTIYSLGDAAQ